VSHKCVGRAAKRCPFARSPHERHSDIPIPQLRIARYTGLSAGVGWVIAAADVTAGEESPDSEGSVLANRQRG